MRQFAIHFHRKEQYDLECWPILAIHVRTPNQSTRWFCLWKDGLYLRFGRQIRQYRIWRWGGRAQ